MNSKTFIIAASLMFGFGSAAAFADTISETTIVGAKKVVITEGVNGLKAAIETAGDTLIFEQPKQPYASTSFLITRSGLSLLGARNDGKSAVSWDLTSGGLGFGFCGALDAPSTAGIEMGKSFEISWFNILAVEATNRYGNSFSLGIGVNWRNYRTTLGNCFTVNGGHVDITPYPEGTEPRLSRIKIFSVQFPLLYTQQLPNKMAFTFGPIFNLNTHASVLTSWRVGNEKAEYKANDINARPFTIDLFASLRLFDFGGFYVRYSPYRAMTGSHPLNFNQLSTGIMLLM